MYQNEVQTGSEFSIKSGISYSKASVFFFAPSHAPMPAPSNAAKTMTPKTIPPVCREAGGTGNGVAVAVAVGITGCVLVEVGIPKVTVSVGVGVSVLISGLSIRSFWPMNISLLLKLFNNFNCSMVVLYASAILHRASSA